MQTLIKTLNDAIQAVNPYVYEMLSEQGKRFFFPKGILSQSAEAATKATRFNATIGTALAGGHAMGLPCVTEQLANLDIDGALLYAPSYGKKALREAWKKKTLHDNPSLASIPMSLPVVTNGLSHGLSLLADMFGEENEPIIYPDMNWGNYALNFVIRRGLKPCYFPFFDGDHFNINAFREALATYSEGQKKVIVLLNFPNNPSGYTPTDAEGDAIAQALIELAERGVNVVTIIDDAYFGLFYAEHAMKESLFTKIAAKHERLLAIKADAATKEVYVWGLRVGFVSFAVKPTRPEADVQALYDAVNAKFGGCIRAVISNCSALSQQIVLRALNQPDFYEQRAKNVATMKERALIAKHALQNPKYAAVWTPFPFNSGYFMCLHLKDIDAEALRVRLLDGYGIGTIAIGSDKLRVAFSGLDASHIEELYEAIYSVCMDLKNA